jgi:hypothetical protein
MKYVLISFLVFFTLELSAQIKKRDLGIYQGTLAAYQINNGKQLLDVEACTIQVTLSKEDLRLDIGTKSYKGLYLVKKTKRRDYRISFTTPNSQIEETFILRGKEKKMNRKGIFPQPDCTLIKP